MISQYSTTTAHIAEGVFFLGVIPKNCNLASDSLNCVEHLHRT